MRSGDRGEAADAVAAAGAARGAPVAIYNSVLRDPATRDPRGFILPSDQPDFLTATKFVNIADQGRRDRAPRHGARSPSAASSIRPARTSSRRRRRSAPHVMDMFEPQDHPDDIPYPGGPPRPPYDVTGYNIAYSMGIKFDRILDGFDGPFEKLTGRRAAAAGKVDAGAGAAAATSSATR